MFLYKWRHVLGWRQSQVTLGHVVNVSQAHTLTFTHCGQFTVWNGPNPALHVFGVTHYSLFSHKHWTLQILYIFSRGGGSVNTNI